jgi:hypothetical protein
MGWEGDLKTLSTRSIMIDTYGFSIRTRASSLFVVVKSTRGEVSVYR